MNPLPRNPRSAPGCRLVKYSQSSTCISWVFNSDDQLNGHMIDRKLDRYVLVLKNEHLDI